MIASPATAPQPASGPLAPACAPPSPPSRKARRAVARAWRRLLDRASLRADLPFGEAGGDSLMLLRLIFDLEAQCASTLPVAPFSIDQRPTEMMWALDRCLGGEAMEADPAAPVVFMLPGVGGDGPSLAQFRAACRPGLRIAPLAPGEWPELIEPGLDIPALAGRLAAQIAAEQPAGRIRLAGYSYGGMLAVAVAAALHAAGRELAVLAILDTISGPMSPHDAPLERSRPTRVESLRQVPEWIRSGQGQARLASFIGNRLLSRRRPRLMAALARRRHLRVAAGVGFHLNAYLRMRLLIDLMGAWRRRADPPPVLRDTQVVLFRSAEVASGLANEDGWRRAYPQLLVVPVPGGHQTMLEPPHLPTLCARFADAVRLVPAEA